LPPPAQARGCLLHYTVSASNPSRLACDKRLRLWPLDPNAQNTQGDYGYRRLSSSSRPTVCQHAVFSDEVFCLPDCPPSSGGRSEHPRPGEYAPRASACTRGGGIADLVCARRLASACVRSLRRCLRQGVCSWDRIGSPLGWTAGVAGDEATAEAPKTPRQARRTPGQAPVGWPNRPVHGARRERPERICCALTGLRNRGGVGPRTQGSRPGLPAWRPFGAGGRPTRQPRGERNGPVFPGDRLRRRVGRGLGRPSGGIWGVLGPRLAVLTPGRIQGTRLLDRGGGRCRIAVAGLPSAAGVTSQPHVYGRPEKRGAADVVR